MKTQQLCFPEQQFVSEVLRKWKIILSMSSQKEHENILITAKRTKLPSLKRCIRYMSLPHSHPGNQIKTNCPLGAHGPTFTDYSAFIPYARIYTTFATALHFDQVTYHLQLRCMQTIVYLRKHCPLTLREFMPHAKTRWFIFNKSSFHPQFQVCAT